MQDLQENKTDPKQTRQGEGLLRETEVRVSGYDPACDDDIERLCHAFVEESLGEYGLTIDRTRLDQMIALCKSHAFYLINAENKAVGVIAGMPVSNFTNGKPALQEIIWFVDKDYRTHGKKLLEAFEGLAVALKMSAIVMGLMVNSKEKILDRLYSQAGYKRFEVQYIKELT